MRPAVLISDNMRLKSALCKIEAEAICYESTNYVGDVTRLTQLEADYMKALIQLKQNENELIHLHHETRNAT